MQAEGNQLTSLTLSHWIAPDEAITRFASHPHEQREVLGIRVTL